MSTVRLPPIPAPLNWDVHPSAFDVHDFGRLSITAGPQTDLFRHPRGDSVAVNAPRLLFAPVAEYLLSARVTVDFRSMFDAGALVVYASDTLWAKLCFERTPDGHPSLVSVVNRGLSDDCNSRLVDSNEIDLRIARTGTAYAFHASQDGSRWDLIRFFHLGDDEPARVGFLAQSPTGESCSVRFSDIRYREARLEDVRSGE